MANFFLAVQHVSFCTTISLVKTCRGKEGQYLWMGVVGTKKVANYDDIRIPYMYTCTWDIATPLVGKKVAFSY